MPKRLVSRLVLFVRFVRSLFRPRADLALENLALRQQVAVLKKENRRPQLTPFDRAFWMMLRKIWPRWKESLHIVKAETVIGWHRKGFRFHWAFISRRGKKRGRPRKDKEIVELIRRMASENPTWGAPRIHGELLKLGLTVSERTVSQYLPKRKPSDDQLKKWRKFLKLHAEGIAAMDFFTVPTATFRVLYVWFVIDHERRKILHFNVTAHPSSEWVIQQLREAFPYDEEPRHLIFDRDAIFSHRVVHTVKTFRCKPTRTACRSHAPSRIDLPPEQRWSPCPAFSDCIIATSGEKRLDAQSRRNKNFGKPPSYPSEPGDSEEPEPTLFLNGAVCLIPWSISGFKCQKSSHGRAAEMTSQEARATPLSLRLTHP